MKISYLFPCSIYFHGMYAKWVTRIFLWAVETVTMGTGVVQKAVGDLCDLGGGAGRKGMMV